LKKLTLFLAIFLCSFKISFASVTDTLSVTPNPFDSVTVIHFDLLATDSVWLDVFDVVGHTVKSFYNGTVLSSGSYSLTLNGDTLPNGIYIVRLKVDTNIYVKKIIKDQNSVGLKDYILNNNKIIFYPNPVKSLLHFTIEGEKRVIITDIYGKEILNSNTNEKTISVSNLIKGNYFVTIFYGSDKKYKVCDMLIKE
jgi:hypothetical protein